MLRPGKDGRTDTEIALVLTSNRMGILPVRSDKFDEFKRVFSCQESSKHKVAFHISWDEAASDFDRWLYYSCMRRAVRVNREAKDEEWSLSRKKIWTRTLEGIVVGVDSEVKPRTSRRTKHSAALNFNFPDCDLTIFLTKSPWKYLQGCFRRRKKRG